MSKDFQNNKTVFNSNFVENRIYINKQKAEDWIETLFVWLFCTQEEYQDYSFFQEKEIALNTLLQYFLKQEKHSQIEAESIANDFFDNCITLHSALKQDLDVVLEFDPAAKSKNEVLLAYPGFFAIATYRIAHYLWHKKIYVLSRIIAEYTHSKTGIDIHPGATIGSGFFIDHGTGIVIGETTIIGDNVKIYQGVTLGALSVSRDKMNKKRHPTIEDNVVIYANATILGGNTIIGKEAVIGGNVWITDSVPPQSLVFHKSELIIKSKQQFPEALNFSI
jgi:serine O-acetyltransferase